MGLAAIDLFIGPAEGAKAPFNFPDEQVNRTPLLFAGMTAYGAVNAEFGHGPVFFCDVLCHHNTIFTDGTFRSAS